MLSWCQEKYNIPRSREGRLSSPCWTPRCQWLQYPNEKTNAASNRVKEKEGGKKKEAMRYALDTYDGFEDGDQTEGMGKP